MISSLVAISLAALALATIVVAACYGGIFVFLNKEDASQLMFELEFDVPLKQRLYIYAVSLLYVGLIACTISAAAITTSSGWKERLALQRSRKRSLLVALLALLTLLYAAAASGLLEHLRDRHLVISGPTDYALIAAVCLNLVVLAPIAEEMFFRGWLYTGLRTRLTPVSSLIVTTAFFAAIHWDANHRRFLIVLPLGLALALVREVSGSIRPTIMLHAAYNFVVILVTLTQV